MTVTAMSSAESPHELNSTGGDFTPLFHESSVTPAAAAESGGESQLSEPSQLAENYRSVYRAPPSPLTHTQPRECGERW